MDTNIKKVYPTACGDFTCSEQWEADLLDGNITPRRHFLIRNLAGIIAVIGYGALIVWGLCGAPGAL